MPYFAVNASASSGESGAVPDTTERMLARSAGSTSASRTMRSAAGTRLAVLGRCRRTASSHESRSNFSSSVKERPSLTHCSTRNRPPRCTIGELTIATPERSCTVGGAVRLVVLGADEHAFERVVGEVDPLRRAGRAAREHLHRDAGARGVGGRAAGGHRDRLAEVVGRERRRPGAGGHEGGDVGAAAGDHVEVERGEVGARALDAAFGIDRDDAAARAEHAEQEADGRGPVAQQHAHTRARGRRRARRPRPRSHRAHPTCATAGRTRGPARRGRSRRPARCARSTRGARSGP